MKSKLIFGSVLASALVGFSTGASAVVTCLAANLAVTATTDSADFVDNGDGTVTHSRTGLTWMRCSLGQTWDGTGCTGTANNYTWLTAFRAAADVNSGASNDDNDGLAGFAGSTDWRLPNKNELASIIEERCSSPAVNATLFPGTPSALYWTSTPYAGVTGYAWYINFFSGTTLNERKDATMDARLVRGGT